MRVADHFQHAPNYYGENQPNFVNNFPSNCCVFAIKTSGVKCYSKLYCNGNKFSKQNYH